MDEVLEKTIESWIYNNPQKCVEKGFPKFYKNIQNQYRLPSSKRIDIFTWEVREDALFFKIIELKRGEYGTSALSQAAEYLFEVLVQCLGHFSEIKYEIVLVGTEMDCSLDKVALVCTNVCFCRYLYDMDGVSFTYDYYVDEGDFCKPKKEPNMRGIDFVNELKQSQ